MNELFPLTGAAAAGVALGAIFYGGLWWSVRRLCVKAEGAWLPAGFAVRTLIVLAGFVAIARRDWRDLAACLAGFLVCRIAMTRLLGARPGTAMPGVAGAGP